MQHQRGRSKPFGINCFKYALFFKAKLILLQYLAFIINNKLRYFIYIYTLLIEQEYRNRSIIIL